MSNDKISVLDIAKAIQGLMTFANISGYVNQVNGEAFRQFSISSITGSQDNAAVSFDIAGQGFRLDISCDPNCKKDGEADAE